MVNPTLERAARAAWCVNPLERGPFNALQYEYIARAVLMAVRPVTPEMLYEAGLVDGARYPWEAMIDAILADGGE